MIRPGQIFFRFVFLLAGLYPGSPKAQKPVAVFSPDQFTKNETDQLNQRVGRNKIIPSRFVKQILIALSYFPALAETEIQFRIIPARTPLESRPEWRRLIGGRKSRSYIITISSKTIPQLDPILFENLDFNAQIGVIGHELSHILDFESRSLMGLVQLGAGQVSKRYLDRFEFRTDSLCIANGLGHQLLAWSRFVRNALHSENWSGAGQILSGGMKRERYMNPSTIISQMGKLELYL